jgi:hypothetical protein
MWILTPSITSAFAAATGELTSASNEQLAEAFARSLLSRSKHSPQRTWLQRLKRDSWTTHLSGAISSDSLGESFTDWWTSSLAATRANHSAQPASDLAPKTHDTSGRLSQPELLSCDQQSAFLRMSKDTFLSGCATCCKTWSDWVTERRGAWRQRVNAARLTRGSGSLSWPSVTTRDHHSQGSSHGYGQQMLSTMLEKNWPTARTNDSAAGRPNDGKDRIGKNGERFGINLSDKVIAEQNWPTANARDWKDSITGTHPPSRPNMSEQTLGQAVSVVHGQAAPASSNTSGSRQGLWPTASVPNGGQTTLGRADKDTKKQVRLEHAVKQWGTPAANDANKTPHCEVNSNQAGLAKSVGLELQRQWATPRTPTGGPESAQRKQELGRTTSGGGDLASQAMTQWPTPMTLAGPTETSNVSGSSEFTRKVDVLLGLRETTNGKRSPTAGKLNPRWVETLMGLPIGWTMPSCIRPVTIAQTSCDSLGMALCQPSQSERSDFFLASCGKEPTK